MYYSVICPVLNEEKYIKRLINWYFSLNLVNFELIIVDGGSSDKTLDILNDLSRSFDFKVINNPKKYVSHGLNLAISESKGEIIIRIDAHTIYSSNYFDSILEVFKDIDADIVGGPTGFDFSELSKFQKALAFVFLSPFGMGNSSVHNLNFEGYTDSVTFGAWKRDVFDKVGLFDEELVRNQDDEFHYRCNEHGLKIFQSPKIKLFYFPRKTISSLFRQYFEYGLNKPYVLRKNTNSIKFRHLAPMVFILYLIFLPFVFINSLYFIPLFAYLSLVFYYSNECKENTLKSLIVLIYPTIHIAYGLGFICGIVKRPKFN